MAGRTKGILGTKYGELFSGIPAGKTLISISSLDSLKADAKRVNVINVDTIYDDLFKDLLLLHFSRRDKTVEELFDPNKRGPLVSLTQKAKLGYALGLIDKTARKDLEYIHRIRNRFAHNTDASFADNEVVKAVRKLSTAKDQEITAKNSYKFYRKALDKCWTSFKETVKQENYREAMLLEAKKKRK